MSRRPRTPLGAEERLALDAFAAEHGWRWKEALRVGWSQAMRDYARRHPATAAVLQKLRNATTFAGAGLVAYRPSPLVSAEERLAAYLEHPSAVQWEHLAEHVIPGTGVMLWQALACVDSAATRGSTPAPPLLREALDAAKAGRIPVRATVGKVPDEPPRRRS
jgi:hypothetical protein